MIHKPPLQRCPACNYTLEGLPDRHRCPECGFAYDRSMWVFRRSRWLDGLVIFSFALGALGFNMSFLSGPGPFLGSPLSGWLAFAAVNGGYAVATCALLMQKRRSAVLSPDGISFIHSDSQREQHSWDQIDVVTLSRIDGKVRLISESGETITAVKYGHFGAFRDARDFVEAAMERKPRAARTSIVSSRR